MGGWGCWSEGRFGHDFDRQSADVVVLFGERVAEFFLLAGAVGLQRLLHEMMKQLLDERRLGFVAIDQVRGQLLAALFTFTSWPGRERG